MGSGNSRRRKGAGKPRHLPKVGSPANQQWEHAAHTSAVAGSPARAIIIGAIAILVIVGLLVLTL